MSDIPKETSTKKEDVFDDDAFDDDALRGSPLSCECPFDYMSDGSLLISTDGSSNDLWYNDNLSLKSDTGSIDVISSNYDNNFSLLSLPIYQLNRATNYNDDNNSLINILQDKLSKSTKNNEDKDENDNHNSESIDKYSKLTKVNNLKINDYFKICCENINKWLCCLNYTFLFENIKKKLSCNNSTNDKENLELNYKIIEANTWYQFIYFYWDGIFNNIKHKRKFLEYCKQISNLKKILKLFSDRIGSNIYVKENDEKENYFRIFNFNIENADKYDSFSKMDSDRACLEIKEMFNLIDNFFIENIIFMKNAKAPIGDFFIEYSKLKRNCLKISKLEENKIFVNSRCKTEIKLYKNNTNIKKIRDEYYKKDKDKYIKTYENKFKGSFEKDKEYEEKFKFLSYFKEYLSIQINEEDIKKGNRFFLLSYKTACLF